MDDRFEPIIELIDAGLEKSLCRPQDEHGCYPSCPPCNPCYPDAPKD